MDARAAPVTRIATVPADYTPLRGPVELGQYTAVTFAKGLTANGIVASFSAKGTPYDNSVKESFFATLEKEHLRSRTFETHVEARASIFRYIEGWYNPRRLHSTLGYRSPDEAERDHNDQPAATARTTTEPTA